MNKNTALDLVNKYIDGWKQNDLNLIVSTLHSDCTIVESHGPVYHGVNAIKKWFEFWVSVDSQVLKWDLTSYYFCDTEMTAFIEWNFECVSKGILYSLPGASLIRFYANKITRINEYRMTKPQFAWDGKSLVSD